MGLLAALFLTATPAHAQDAATAAGLRDRALADPTAWRLLESLTTEVGPRPVGTPAMERARDWAVANLRALGFANVKVEEFAKPAWIRGPESAAMTAPYPMKLRVLGLGRSPATPPGGVEAEVVVFDTYAELLARPPGALVGKIALVNQPMARTQDGSGYGAVLPMRTKGPAEAARRGAAAYLVRSLSTSDTALSHAGATTFAEDDPRIPAAALAVPDADHLARLAARGPVRVRLDLQPTVDADAVAWNISGELPGSERPDEVVLIGAHLDSWDVSPGAHDDAAGIAITTAAARLIGRLPRYPRRTIRVVMFGSEETGGSSAAYAQAHGGDNIVAASESDFGGGRIWAVRLPDGAHDHPAARMAADALAPLGVFVDAAPATYGGADIAGLKAAGVPVFQLRPDGRHYFDLHHSADDTLDKVDREALNQAVAAWTTLVYLLADSELDVRPPRPEPEPEPEPEPVEAAAAAPDPEAPLATAPSDGEEEPDIDPLERLSRELIASPTQAEDPDE